MARAHLAIAEKKVGEAQGRFIVLGLAVPCCLLVASARDMPIAVRAVICAVTLFVAIPIAALILRDLVREAEAFADSQRARLRREEANLQDATGHAETKARELNEARTSSKSLAESRVLAEREAQTARHAAEVEQLETAAESRRRAFRAERATRERHALAACLKAALEFWNSTAHKDPALFVEIHAEEIVGQRDRIVAAYHDATLPGGTADDCLERAALALREFPAEVAYWLRNPADRTVEHIAHILRCYTGHAREVLLPAAFEMLHKRQDPAPAARQRAIQAASVSPPPVTGPLSDLPREEQTAIASLLKDLRTLGVLEEELDAEYERYESKLRRRTPPLNEEAITRALEKCRANLDKLKSDWAASKDLSA